MLNRSFDLFFLPDWEQTQVIFGDRSLFRKGGRRENRKTQTKHNVISHAAILTCTEQLLQSCKFDTINQTIARRIAFLPFLYII